MKKGIFIAFEGIDGSGKSTQLKLLGAQLRNNKLKVHETAEPTSNPVGLLIRQILRGHIQCAEPAIAALFAADRLSHLLDQPGALIRLTETGVNVICDRYYFSSYAYHSVNLPMEWVISVNDLSAKMMKPDLNLFIDVPVDICLNRMSAARVAPELYEAENNLKRVRDKYFEAFDRLRHTENVRIIDGNRPAEEVADAVWQAVRLLFEFAEPDL